jgi:hypothetical protein
MGHACLVRKFFDKQHNEEVFIGNIKTGKIIRPHRSGFNIKARSNKEHELFLRGERQQPPGYGFMTRIITSGTAATKDKELNYRGIICFIKREPSVDEVLKITEVRETCCFAVIGKMVDKQFQEFYN